MQLGIVAMALLALSTCLLAQAAPLTEEQILAGADARIREHRMAEVAIRVTRDGRPVPEARVEIEQTRHAFLFGANVFGFWEIQEPLRSVYLRRFEEIFNFATLPFYWRRYEPQRGRPRVEEMRACVQWCRQRGITPKIHPLIFATSAGAPEWLPRDPDEVLGLMYEYVDRTTREFAGEIDVIDVVNEAVAPFRFDTPVTDAWRRAGPVEVSRRAFRIAREANPDATLLINDYVLDEQYQALLAALVDESGEPLYDAVGIQSHMFAGVWPTQWQWQCCETFSQYGRPLHFTEVTILSGAITEGPLTQAGRGVTTPEGEAEQADQAERLYTVLFSHPAVEAITWWTFCDLRPWDIPPGGLLRKDVTPKPAYERLRTLIRERWWTRDAGRTGADGAWRCRAFYGTHRVRVTAPDGQAVEREIQLDRGGPTEFAAEF